MAKDFGPERDAQLAPHWSKRWARATFDPVMEVPLFGTGHTRYRPRHREPNKQLILEDFVDAEPNKESEGAGPGTEVGPHADVHARWRERQEDDSPLLW